MPRITGVTLSNLGLDVDLSKDGLIIKSSRKHMMAVSGGGSEAWIGRQKCRDKSCPENF